MTAHLLSNVEISPNLPATASIIWLHGLGANGYDFASVAEQLQILTGLPIRFILPHAPTRPVTVNKGYVMPAWYDIIGLDLASRQDKEGIQASERTIQALIQQEQERGIPSKHIFLAGFSQGGAVALHTGLRYPQQLGGIIALSTYLPLADRLATEKAAVNSNIPIFFAHGLQDKVVSIDWAQTAYQFLLQLNYPAVWYSYAMDHSVCLEEINDISQWLKEKLSESKIT